MLVQQVNAKLVGPPIAALGSGAGERWGAITRERAFGVSRHGFSFLYGVDGAQSLQMARAVMLASLIRIDIANLANAETGRDVLLR